MFLIRDIMYCRPGKARAMVDKFVALSKMSQQMGMGSMRIMTDVSAERYWTVVSEMEVERPSHRFPIGCKGCRRLVGAVARLADEQRNRNQ